MLAGSRVIVTDSASGSSTSSSTAFTDSVCAVLQSTPVKVRVREPAKERPAPAPTATTASPAAALATATVTSAAGRLASFTVKAAFAPPSVTVTALADTVRPAASALVVFTGAPVVASVS